MNKKSTIDDVAKLANVSVATVSRIINNSESVSNDAKEKVLAAIKELNFIPKNAKFKTKKTKNILVCVPDFSNPFNGPVIDGMQESAKSKGYNLLFMQDFNHHNAQNDYHDIIKHTDISGIIIFCAIPNAKFLEDLNIKCPVVCCSEFADNANISSVYIDDINASKQAVKFLAATGCKKIGLFNCNSNFRFAKLREQGYKEALVDAQLDFNPEFRVYVPSNDYSLAYSYALHMLSKNKIPDAIFAASDIFAVAIVNAARKLNINIPQDLSVIGFDNVYLSVMSNPQITTIEQPMHQLGYQACELLLEKINYPNTSTKHIVLDTELVVRQSTKF